MRNIALRLSYVGTRYHGWQMQRNADSVQARLSDAVYAVTRERPVLHGCGRTDAGVHAPCYVASFQTRSAIPITKFAPALGANLPRDIAVWEAREMPEAFHARFSCEEKEYTYLVVEGRVKNPFYLDRACFHPLALDTDAMAQAAQAFCGTHDFASMRSLGTEVRSTVRTIRYLTVSREGERVLLRVCADGFLYNMARTIAGTLLLVGEHKLAPGAIADILRAGERSAAGPTAPAAGLYLTKLRYENWEVYP